MSDQNEIKAQAAVIYPDYLRHFDIGDTDINWVASDGDPSSVAGAQIGSDAYFDNIDQGVVLTPAVDAKFGSLYWQKDYDYTRSILIAATTRSGGGDGADGITIFFGGDGASSIASDEGGISIYIEEYNSDVIKIFKSGSLLGSESYLALKTLDDNTYNNWEVVYEYKDSASIILHLKMNGNYVFRKNIATWTPNGTFIGISGVCGSQNNTHSVKSFCVKSARAWLHYNF
jgi:hypothetical protein